MCMWVGGACAGVMRACVVHGAQARGCKHCILGDWVLMRFGHSDQKRLAITGVGDLCLNSLKGCPLAMSLTIWISEMCLIVAMATREVKHLLTLEKSKMTLN